MKGYLARPKANGKYGSVVVIHENRGLNPHIEDVTRRLAWPVFWQWPPTPCRAAGGTPTDETQMRELFGKLDAEKTKQNFLKGLDYLKAVPTATANWVVSVFAGVEQWPINWRSITRI